ncbi:MAG: transposase, partial [Moorella sp. (in: Bacteria)]|nr:transposase [Moorella sp. (in: firmicutes)]
RKARSIIERVFGEAKKWHGLGRARYRELWRVYVQAAITFAVMNVKKIVTLPGTRGEVCPRAA